METIEIAAALRAQTGKGANRRLRVAGKVPATFYGPKRQTLSIEVDAKEFDTKLTKVEGSHLIRMKSDAPELEGCVALLRETQSEPVSGRPVHADFLEIDLTKKLEVRVPLHYVGKAIGVALQGGILQPIQRELEVVCLPTDIPEFVEVDVSGLNIHDVLHVSDLKLPAGVEGASEADLALVTVMPPTVEEVKVEAAEGVVAEAAPAAGAEAAKPEEKKGGAA